MQVHNQYPTFHNQSNSQSHTHHITECMHEEEFRKREADMRFKSDKGTKSTYQKGDAAKEAVEYVASFSVADKELDKKKFGKRGLKGYWDSLGEDGEEGFDFRKSISEGAHGAAAAVQSFISFKLLKPYEGVRERIKVLPAALKRHFSKGKEAFDALMEENPGFNQKEKKSNSKKKDESVHSLKPANEHLMDSYNKTGGYCQLQDNLTYQKPKAIQRADKSGTAG